MKVEASYRTLQKDCSSKFDYLEQIDLTKENRIIGIYKGHIQSKSNPWYVVSECHLVINGEYHYMGTIMYRGSSSWADFRQEFLTYLMGMLYEDYTPWRTHEEAFKIEYFSRTEENSWKIIHHRA